jgi:hypothetical protein
VRGLKYIQQGVHDTPKDVYPGPAASLIEYLQISFRVPPFRNPCSVGPHQLRSGLAGIPCELADWESSGFDWPLRLQIVNRQFMKDKQNDIAVLICHLIQEWPILIRPPLAGFDSTADRLGGRPGFTWPLERPICAFPGRARTMGGRPIEIRSR